jgi:hypothetical protein
VSEGADFLALVRDKVVDLVAQYEEARADVVAHHRESIQSEASVAGTSADPDVKWRQFVDLHAYKEEVAEAGTPRPDTPESHAELALSYIGFRLAAALLTEIEEGSK